MTRVTRPEFWWGVATTLAALWIWRQWGHLVPGRTSGG